MALRNKARTLAIDLAMELSKVEGFGEGNLNAFKTALENLGMAADHEFIAAGWQTQRILRKLTPQELKVLGLTGIFREYNGFAMLMMKIAATEMWGKPADITPPEPKVSVGFPADTVQDLERLYSG